MRKPLKQILVTAVASGDVDAFDHRLRELGWIDGRTVTVEYRWAEGHSERYAAIAAEFVRQKVDVIVTSGSAVPAAKQQTTTIPIVFAVAADPIRTGMVASLAHPGGNVTGLSVQSADLAAKRLELLREAIPGLRRLAILGNVGYSAALFEMADVESSARKIGLDVERLEIRRAEDIEPALVGQQRGVGALYVCQELARRRKSESDYRLGLGSPSSGHLYGPGLGRKRRFDGVRSK